jgi:predicted transcriptional regulator
MAMKILKVGIASYSDMKARTMAIARGKLKPLPGDPKVWFPSAESLVKVLSDKNRMLLGTIRDAEPKSLAELAELTGRKTSNLSRTLKTMERYGIVKLKRERHGRVTAHVPYQSVTVDLSLRAPERRVSNS